MATAGALEDQELMSEGKNLSLQRSSSLKGLPSRRKQRENDREHVAEKLQRRLPKFNQLSQNGVFGRHTFAPALDFQYGQMGQTFLSCLLLVLSACFLRRQTKGFTTGI
jgi:hypothetical protein